MLARTQSVFISPSASERIPEESDHLIAPSEIDEVFARIVSPSMRNTSSRSLSLEIPDREAVTSVIVAEPPFALKVTAFMSANR